ncbi:MAG: ribosome recycling factor [Candidatus Nealsonbacteria bacterium CG_4_10_14_0_8_um_filter_35_10]|uniref:Ribosome recycling factor n=2 Tax=Candidatus Nealsoniibacteriota TaxID=1817911 RepID=A0A2M7R8D1_9BACT|nr:MAG: ribosome recycling factor [Parcubacteria group bacterium CG1_02_36_42]PIY91046.1 MAG: ribosome recycling factor [Candidatus Nealsonbacteria bacterium CG_4_10_14_0_8_um_filter_35_10]PJB99561.1 MAG: ribosome recycling factor [Candidatus Nealsonbacteria bacterium CG_4_9_14_0_8_um_filter_35_12]
MEKKRDYQEIIDKIKPEFDKVLNFFERELAKVRTGRASSTLVEDIQVECFGQRFPLKQLGLISLPEPKKILIQPWDNSYLEPIVNALSKSGLGISPVVDKNLIRISLPPLSEEYRQDLLRLLGQKIEETKRTIRHWRETAWDEIQDGFQAGEIREDDKYRGKDKLQELVDEYNEKIEELAEKKKKEILE